MLSGQTDNAGKAAETECYGLGLDTKFLFVISNDWNLNGSLSILLIACLTRLFDFLTLVCF